MQHITYTRDV